MASRLLYTIEVKWLVDGCLETLRAKLLEAKKMTEANETNTEPKSLDEVPRIEGKIIKLDPTGYGFITSRQKPFTRIFFHWSGLLPTTKNFLELRKGMKLEFDCVRYIDKGIDKGWRAHKIEVKE